MFVKTTQLRTIQQLIEVIYNNLEAINTIYLELHWVNRNIPGISRK